MKYLNAFNIILFLTGCISIYNFFAWYFGSPSIGNLIVNMPIDKLFFVMIIDTSLAIVMLLEVILTIFRKR